MVHSITSRYLVPTVNDLKAKKGLLDYYPFNEQTLSIMAQ